MFIRTITVKSSNGTVHEYVRLVEAYRENGKPKQRVVADFGRKDLLTAFLPKLQSLLLGEPTPVGEDPDEVHVFHCSTWGPVLVVRHLFHKLNLWNILDELLPAPKEGPSYTDRVFVLVANRLIAPKSEHGLAAWLDSAFVCDRQGRRFVPHWEQHNRVQVQPRQLAAWYRTLDVLHQAKEALELALFKRLRDLFSLKPDLVLYDITSTYFEGAGPKEFAKHGHSRDGKSQNVQVVIGLVLVCGWPIAHHVWSGNRKDDTTVSVVVKDLQERFKFKRIVFVGDRGMVTEDNLEQLLADEQGFLVGVKRRRNEELDNWLQKIDEQQWIDCPVGITARERKQQPPRTRVQEIVTTDKQRRVFVIDSEERREYEQAKRTESMKRVGEKLEKVRERVASGKLKVAEKIGSAVERALGSKGKRYYAWELQEGQLRYFEHPVHFEREKRLEGRYVLLSSEPDLSALDAVALYKQLTEVERGFRRLKDVLELRPVYHRVENRVRAHVQVAVLGLLLETLLEQELRAGGYAWSAEQALGALETVRYLEFELQGQRRSGVSASNPRAQQVLRALGISDTRPPVPPSGCGQIE